MLDETKRQHTSERYPKLSRSTKKTTPHEPRRSEQRTKSHIATKRKERERVDHTYGDARKKTDRTSAQGGGRERKSAERSYALRCSRATARRPAYRCLTAILYPLVFSSLVVYSLIVYSLKILPTFRAPLHRRPLMHRPVAHSQRWRPTASSAPPYALMDYLSGAVSPRSVSRKPGLRGGVLSRLLSMPCASVENGHVVPLYVVCYVKVKPPKLLFSSASPVSSSQEQTTAQRPLRAAPRSSARALCTRR